MDFIAAFILARIAKIVVGPALDIEQTDPREETVLTMVGTPDKWTPTDEEWASLHDKDSPHEPPAVLRAFRAGTSRDALVEAVGMGSRHQVMDAMKDALDKETEAHARGRKIHDPVFKKEGMA